MTIVKQVLITFAFLAPVLLAFPSTASEPIVDVRFDAPHAQVRPSEGDQWAPTWGRDDVLYTANDDGSNFGGVSRNPIAFGKLEGNSPYDLRGETISGMQEFKDLSYGPEAASWRSLDTLKIHGVFYRLSRCDGQGLASTCLESSVDAKAWTALGPVLQSYGLDDPRFIVWSKQYETGWALKPDEYAYVASYVGVIDGEDQYLISRAPIGKLNQTVPSDWKFRHLDNSWGDFEGAAPNPIAGRHGSDDANWKATNAYSIDGILYMFITRCIYPSGSNDPKKRHVWFNSSIIKSSDGGRTWARTAQENYEKPMFPGQRFGTPYFVWYGKNGVASIDNADKYVFAVSNNGFFENGDDFVIGRVLRSRLPQLSAGDWSFYSKGDGLKDSSWALALDEAQPILSNPGKASMTGMTYIGGLQRYVMVSWHYKQDNFEAGINAKDLSTLLEFFEAPKPWGPWTKFKTLETGRLGWYTPIIGQRFQTRSKDGTVSAFLYATGFFTKPEGGLDLSLYKLNYVPITFSTKPLKHRDPAYVGGQ